MPGRLNIYYLQVSQLSEEIKTQRVEWFVKGHIMSEWQKWDFNSGFPSSRIHILVASLGCLIKKGHLLPVGNGIKESSQA